MTQVFPQRLLMVARRIDRCPAALSQKAAGRRELTPPKIPAIRTTLKFPHEIFKLIS